MNYIASACTDIGLRKSTNQDSLMLKIVEAQNSDICMAVLCDGMGGLEKGELASKTVIMAFERWFHTEFVNHLRAGFIENRIFQEWMQIVYEQNRIIKEYGARSGINLGTTLTVALLTADRYLLMNVGDSRVYVIKDNIFLLTKDHTFVNQEVERGHLTPEQALVDPRRSILLQCVGASEVVSPDCFSGDIETDAVYMLCSDGFRHEITPEEIFQFFHPNNMLSEADMTRNMTDLIELNKERMESDNISVITIRTF